MISAVEPWSIWLDFRLPHYDAMGEDAAATLVGSKTAVVRTDYNGTGVRPWHVTLTTLESETPDPEATVAAAKKMKPVGVVLHHLVVASLQPEHEEQRDPRAAELAGLLGELHGELDRLRRVLADQRASTVVKEARCARFSEAAADLEARTKVVIGEGLEKRLDTFLVPSMVIFRRDLEARRAHKYLLETVTWLRLAQQLESLDWRPEGIAVCRACTLVFRPRRRGTAEFCQSLCRARGAAPAFGEQPLDLSKPHPIRVPSLMRGTHVVMGWQTKWLGLCPGCGKPFAGRRDQQACGECSPRLRQQRYRSRQASAEASDDEPSLRGVEPE